MKSRFFSSTVLLCFLLNAIVPINAEALNNKNTISASKFKISKTSEYLSLDHCIVKEINNPDAQVNVFKKIAITNRVPNRIRVLLYLIDFKDLKNNKEKQFNLDILMHQVSNFYYSVSNGKIRFTWAISQHYKRMSNAIDYYGSNERSKVTNIAQIIKDAEIEAFKEFNSNLFDIFIAVPPNRTSIDQISTSITSFKDDNQILDGTILAGDFWASEKRWTLLAHEIGHLLGLLDLYSVSAASIQSTLEPSFQNQFKFMGLFDVMNWPTGPAPELTAWNRWFLGLLDSSEIRCLPNVETITILSPIQSKKGGIKVLFYKVNDFKILVIENRNKIGFDCNLPSWATGLLVYLVDVNIKSGEGPLKIVPHGSSHKAIISQKLLQNSQKLVYESLEVQNISSNLGQILVRVRMI